MNDHVPNNTKRGRYILLLITTLLVVILGSSIALVLTLTHQPGKSTAVSQKPDGSPLYIVASDGVYRVGSASGKVRWHYTSPPSVQTFLIQSTLLVADNVVCFEASADGNSAIYALDASNGHLLWAQQLDQDPGVFLKNAGGVLYVSAGSRMTQSVSAFDMHTGVRRWAIPLPFNGVPFEPPQIGSINNGVVYIGKDAMLLAVHAKDGTQVWKTQVNGASFLLSPVLVNGSLYAVSRDQKSAVYAFDPSTGIKRWQSQEISESATDLLVSDTVIYMPASNSAGNENSIYAFARTDGSLRWKQSLQKDVTLSQVLQGDTATLYFFTYDSSTTTASGSADPSTPAKGRIVALNASSGTSLWSRSVTFMDQNSPLLIAGSLLYCGGTDGSIYILNASNGKQVAHYQVLNDAVANPTIRSMTLAS